MTERTPAHIYKRGDLQLRLINDDVIVELDALREKSEGGIVIPDTVGDRGDAGILTMGTVKAVGFIFIKEGPDEGKAVPIPGLSVGEKVVFTRYYAEQHTNHKIQAIFGKGVIRLKPLDILLAFGPEDADRVLR